MSCSQESHDRTMEDAFLWRANTATRWCDEILGTDRVVEKGVCAACSRTLVRRSQTLADAIVGDDADIVSEWERAAATVTAPMPMGWAPCGSGGTLIGMPPLRLPAPRLGARPVVLGRHW